MTGRDSKSGFLYSLCATRFDAEHYFFRSAVYVKPAVIWYLIKNLMIRGLCPPVSCLIMSLLAKPTVKHLI